MSLEITEAVWLDERHEVSLDELVECSGLSREEVLELTAFETFSPDYVDASARIFKARCIPTARAARRLRDDFGLAPDALALVMALRERIERLEDDLRRLEARIPPRR